MSARLPLPVRRVLREPLDSATLERIASTRPARERRRSSRPARVSVAIAAAAALVLVAWRAWPVGGPVRLADGSTLDASLVHPGAVTLDDGSTLTLAAETSLSTLENDAHDVSFLVENGEVTFDVVPHGPRRWTIECGLATVVVVGTRFTIVRDASHLSVAVARGVVLVRGERVPDRAVRLEAGQRIELSDEAPTPIVENVEPHAPAPEQVTVGPTAPPRARAPSWRALAEETRWDDAYRALGPRGMSDAADHANVEELLLLADVARLSGHLEEAVAPLERVIDEHPTDPRASLSAFSLGRIEDQLARPVRAARAFGIAMELGHLPATLRADALARRVSSLERSGDHAGALDSARTYVSDYPDGAAVREMRAMEGY